MKIVCLLGTLVLAAVLEQKWGRLALTQITYKGSCDKALAEPGETLVWTGAAENRSRLPVTFVRLREYFPMMTEIRESDSWQAVRLYRGAQRMYVEEKFSLPPGRGYKRQLHFALPRRGCYELGSCRLAAGDLLGLEETACSEKASCRVVIMPERIAAPENMQALGGFLGEISVRRFIMEDPVLTVSFRDYTGREPMKDISWTRTAAAGRLQVRQYDHTAQQMVTVLLNVEGAKAQELERCFSLTRMVCEELEKQHISYGLRTNGNLIGPVGRIEWLAEGLGAQHLNTLLYGLGQADGTCFYSLKTLVEQSRSREKSCQGYIVITPPLTTDGKQYLRRLREADGNPVCLLEGRG